MKCNCRNTFFSFKLFITQVIFTNMLVICKYPLFNFFSKGTWRKRKGCSLIDWNFNIINVQIHAKDIRAYFVGRKVWD